jgi:hypothetical protein
LTFSPSELVERDFLRTLISYPEAGEEVIPAFSADLLQNPTLKKIFSALKSLYLKDSAKNPHILLDQFEDLAVKNFLAECAMFETPVEPIELINDCVKKLETNAHNRLVNNIKLQIKERQNRGQDTSDLVKQLFEVQSSKIKDKR